MIHFSYIEAHDFGPLTELNLSLDHRGLVLIRGENNDTAAADSNGAGKSHIFKAITWCNFGDTVEGDKHDEVIRRGTKNTSVKVGWKDGDVDWAVQREKARGSAATLKLFQAGELQSGMTMKETQEQIHRLLGMDFHTWRNTVLYGQGDLVRFADRNTTDSDRKLILKRILRLDVLDKALKLARTRSTELQKKADKAANSIEKLEAELEGLSDGATLKEQITELKTEAAGLKKKAARVPRLEKVLEKIDEQINALGTRRDGLTELSHQGMAEATARSKMLAEAAGNQRIITDLNEQIETLADGKCPTCGSPSNSVHVKRKLAELEARRTAENNEMEQAHSKAQAHSNKADELEREHDEQASGLDEEFEKWHSKKTDMWSDLKMAKFAVTELERNLESIQRFNDELKQLKDRKTGLVQGKVDLRIEIEQLEIDRDHLEFWSKGFSNSGLPSYLMDAVIPTLTDRSNHYLEILSDGDIRVSFDTQSKLKTGELREKLIIKTVTEGVEGATPSGGQNKKISIAVDLALMDLVASREHAAIDMLLMDEVLDGLDATGKSRVMDLLRELRERKSTIMVVSHDPGLSELFESEVVVVKIDGQSQLEN